MMSAICRPTLLGALLLIASGASAQGFFVGGALGQARQDDYQIGGTVTVRDDSDTSYRLFGGYLVSPMQGVILSVIDLGTARYEGPAFGGFTDALSADGVDISYIAGWTPGNQRRMSLFGTLGVFVWDQDVRYIEQGTLYKYGDSGTSFSFGLGSEINFAKGGSSAWAIHLEWQTFRNVGQEENSGHEYDRQVFSIGADYRFGRKP